MKKILIILKKCFEKTLSSFWYGEDGNPPHALYISILATMILAVCKINKFTNNCSGRQFVLGLTESLMASVFLAYIIDLSRYISDTITKKKKNKDLLVRLNYSARLLIIYLFKISLNKNKGISCYELIENCAFGKFDDSNFKNNRDISIALSGFVLEAKVLVAIERGWLDFRHLDQLIQIQISYEDHLARFEDLKSKRIETEDNVLRYKEFISSLSGFFLENLTLFKKGGLLEEMGSKTIFQIQEENKVINET